MATVCILGAGDIGSAAARALAASSRVDRILIIDPLGSVAAGQALDLLQAGAVGGWQTRIHGGDDLSRVAGCAVCVVADRYGRPAAEWRGGDGAALLKQIRPYLGHAPIVFAGASQSDLLLWAAREGGTRRERLIGSAPEAFASAVRSIVAVEARCSPSEVMLAVLGAPGSGFVVPWSDASIGGHAAHRVLTPAQVARIELRMARLWPPGPFTLGLAAARAVEAIVSCSRRAFSASTVLAGEFGVRDKVGVLRVLLSSTGIVHAAVPSLETRERVRLDNVLA